MQENEFERKIREKMDELQLVPGEEVWKKVSANIHKEKRRKRFLFFLLIFGLLAGSAGMYFYINSNRTEPALAKETNAAPSDNSSNKKDTGCIKSKADSNVSGLSAKPINIASNKQVVVIKKTEEAYSSKKQFPNYTRNITTKNNLMPSVVVADKEVEGKKSRLINKKETTDNQSKPVQKGLAQQNNSLQQPSITKADSAKENSPEKQITEAKKDSSKPAVAERKAIQNIKIASNKKWNIGFTAFSGISNNLSRLNLFAGGAANYQNSSPGSISNGGTGNFSINKLTFKSSFSYGVGIYIKKQISKRTGFSAGVNYHFETATSNVGSRSSTATTFYDASLRNNAMVDEYYGYGESEKYTNKYYLCELPLNVLVQLNKNQNKQVVLTAGISPAYLIYSKALHANTSQNVYYADNDQFKKLQLFAQTGIQLTVSNARHFNITAGPEAQYGLNNMATSASGTNQHLFSATIKANVILK
ncbi:MAG: PorT family protein [Segetibacter sp.]|nr:PorT family protein [Segetibacter sp.]